MIENCENRLILAKVIVKNKMSRIFMVHCVHVVCISHAPQSSRVFAMHSLTIDCYTERE